jgi:hypothetical protein
LIRSGARIKKPRTPPVLKTDNLTQKGERQEYVSFCSSGGIAFYQSEADGYTLFQKNTLLRCINPESLGKIPDWVWHGLRFVKAAIKIDSNLRRAKATGTGFFSSMNQQARVLEGHFG